MNASSLVKNSLIFVTTDDSSSITNSTISIISAWTSLFNISESAAILKKKLAKKES